MLDDAIRKAGNIGGGLSKGASEETFKRAEGPHEEALAVLGIQGTKSVFDTMFGEDRNVIPPQFTGNTDIEQQEKDFWDTYNFANSKFFNETVVDNDYRVAQNHPALKSLFLVDFEFNPNIVNDNRMSRTYPKSMSFLLKNMTMPKATINTQRINAYNIKKIIPQDISYEPITCTFGEIFTAYRAENNEVSLFDLFQQYMSYYYNDFVRDENNLHYGHASGRIEKQFISNISIYFFWADGSRKIRLRNPYIKDFSYDNLDYATDEQLTLSCNIEYEYIDMHNLNITYDEFIESTTHILDEFSTNLKTNNVENPYANEDILQPGQSPIDDQRRVNIDGPAGQTLARLAEIGAVDLGSEFLNSDNAIIRETADSTLSESRGVIGGGLDAGAGLFGGEGGLL